MRRYAIGEIVGAFEIRKFVGSEELTTGSYQGIYRVRCFVCGKESVLPTKQIRYRKDCGCKSPLRYGRKYAKKKMLPQMDEGEIYRSWKSALDPRDQLTVLAQLNAVPVAVIEEIIRRQQALWEA